MGYSCVGIQASFCTTLRPDYLHLCFYTLDKSEVKYSVDYTHCQLFCEFLATNLNHTRKWRVADVGTAIKQNAANSIVLRLRQVDIMLV